ncbi:hypothetical protein COCMIDRAFT_24728 [Bipolaris oryzae ATCC 44560]|uniref:Uncharacterized protein n=1 Tax=Bipolaris oryzae ATCC 44560 TaxID=930090 RepID=W6ZC76_COCMI|nr:uncharacterized protein COCMIDRAFT_24728 [Bipolaris oryzae ATCC 44560]EUC47408.1 hypothetical protein COCMIDRAFT_24728 [Bipolaris oryzae ATCC 44560]
MANRAVYISAQDPRRLMRELLEIMRNDEANNHLSLSCMKAMERYLVTNLHQSSLPISLLDEIRAADNRAVQQARQFEASRGNRGVLGGISKVFQGLLTYREENQKRVSRNITRSFLVTRYDLGANESRPVHHKPPPAPANTRGSSSTEKASSVGTPQEYRLPSDVNHAFYMADDEDDTVVDEPLLDHHQPPSAPNARDSSSTERASSVGTPKENRVPRNVNQAFYVADEDDPFGEPPVHHEPRPAPLSARDSSSTERASSVGTPSENRLPCDVNQAFYVADEDEPPRLSLPSLAQTSIDQTSAPKRNRRVLGEISSIPLGPMIGTGENHLGVLRNINQSFYVAEDDDPVIHESPPVTGPAKNHFGGPLNANQSFQIAEDDPVVDESQPVHHEPPRAPLNPRTQTPIRQPTRVSKPKTNTQQNATSTPRPTQNDQPYRRVIANANHDATVTLDELEQSFIEQTGPADDGSDTEEATEPDTPPDPNTARAPHVFEEIPKIIVTDSRENIQAIVEVDPAVEPSQPTERSREPTPNVPEYNFLKHKKAGYCNKAAAEPQRLYPTTIVEERDEIPPSWSARHMGTSPSSGRPGCSSPPIQRAGSASVAATKATKGTRGTKGKQAQSVEPRSTRARQVRSVETRTTTTTGKRARGAEAQTPKKRVRKTGGGRKDV